MYEIIRIDTLEDARLDAYTRLTERELRCVLEPEKGIFIAESLKVIERAVEAGVEPLSFLLGERWLEQILPLLDSLETIEPVPVFVAPMELMEKLTGFSVTRGALAACRRPPLSDAGSFLKSLVDRAGGCPVRVCVLEGIVDHTNVGAIFRSSAALNVDRRAVRVSMGTVFQVPWTRIGSDARHWPGDGFEALRRAGFASAALALTDDSVSLDDPALAEHERLALFMGTEGEGLCSRTIEESDVTVRIPMAHGVDSLNVAAASAVAFWQLCPHTSNAYHYRPGRYA